MAASSSELSTSAILAATRDGAGLSAAQIESFIGGVVDGSVSRAQAAAWLAFVYHRGLSDEATVALTDVMTRSGDQLSWPSTGGAIVDKHSTGGVGDKVSLVLAPLWAELGFRVPMISGRGLAHTGGTLDKLESIPGFRCDLDIAELQVVLAKVGCFISGQTAELAPADRFLYALRDETSTVASEPLVTSSILSKKLAEGLDRLVLDVKYGSGAFFKARDAAEKLARRLEAVSAALGTPARAVLTPMNEPLGEAVGNALEVEESIRCLRGEGPADLHDLVVRLADHPEADAVLRSGRALGRFERMVAAQGGDLSVALKGTATVEEHVVESTCDGTVAAVDALSVGRAAFRLGAGRARAGEPVHHGVGVRVHASIGRRVAVGEPVFTVVHANKGVEEALALLRQGLRVVPD